MAYEDTCTNSENILTAECKGNTIMLKTLIDMNSHISSAKNKDNDNVKRIKQIFLKIDSKGIEMFSDMMKIMTAFVNLDKTFFTQYTYNDEEPLCIGISLDILKTCFKNIHRNDNLKFTISKSEYSIFPNTICFVVNDTKGFSIKFNIVQAMDNINYDDYKKLVNIPSNRFSNLYREIGGVKKQVKITQDDNFLKLSSTMIDIAENWVKFPMQDVSTEDFEEITIKSEYFKIISKIAIFDKNVVFAVNKSKHLLFKTNIKTANNIIGSIFINVC